jgi:microcystin degradation protein MlrC
MIAQYRTSVPPINEFVVRMKSLEGKDGILSVSLSHGFSFADVEDVGTRTLVVADRDTGKAEALAKKLGEELWANRERYATKYLSIPEAMERAASHNQGPLVLADRADNPGSGAPGDSTFVLKALVDKQIGPALFGVMWDPMAFRIAEEAGEGARLRMRLGGKSGEVSGQPVDLDVTVKKIARGVRQPYGPVMVPLGDMALLSSEHVDVAICTFRTQTFHADAFKAVGADPADYRVVVVKSAQHFYNGFAGLAKEILYVASPGAADPDVTRLPYTKRKTPFWPKVADPWVNK